MIRKKYIMKYEIDNLLVVGNGFDMDLGLKTSYSSFIESEEWKKMRNNRKKEYSYPSLIDYISKEYEALKEGWFDLEKAMLSYVIPKDGVFHVNNVEEDKKDYDAICTSLVEFLCNLFWSPSPLKVVNRMQKSFAARLLCDFCDPLSSSIRDVMYTFNYTPIEVVYSSIGGFPTTLEYYNIHGKINKEDFFNKTYNGSSIILGIIPDSSELIAPGYSFLVKSNHPQYCSSYIEKDLIQARNVYIFGHSMNKMDFSYFEGYFKMLRLNTDKERRLTIITKNDSSRLAILDNLRKMKIPVEEVFSHTNVGIILTDNLESDKKIL